MRLRDVIDTTTDSRAYKLARNEYFSDAGCSPRESRRINNKPSRCWKDASKRNRQYRRK